MNIWISIYKNKPLSLFEITRYWSFVLPYSLSKSQEIILLLLSLFCAYFLSTFSCHIVSNKWITSAIHQNGIHAHVFPLHNRPYCPDVFSLLSYCWEPSFSLRTDAVSREAFLYYTSQLLNKEKDPVNKMSQLRRMFGSSRISDTETRHVALKISTIRMWH